MPTTYPLEPRGAAAAQVRATLRERQSRLRAEVEATRSRGAGDPTRIAREATDRGEDAESQAALGLDDAEVARDVSELREIGEALARLDAGRYGLCKDCDEPIDGRRLAAEPFAIRCTACQGRVERVRSRHA